MQLKILMAPALALLTVSCASLSPSQESISVANEQRQALNCLILASPPPMLIEPVSLPSTAPFPATAPTRPRDRKLTAYEASLEEYSASLIILAAALLGDVRADKAKLLAWNDWQMALVEYCGTENAD